jgi:hypothetical protein
MTVSSVIALRQCVVAGKNDQISIYIGPDAPFSIDPIEFDYSKHIPIQSTLNTKLVSGYKDSQLSPALAESWVSLKGGTEWRFRIRKGLYFSDGEEIQPRDVLTSFSRLFFQLKKRGSTNRVLRLILGVEALESPLSDFEGLTLDDEDLVFKFKSPVPDFLEILAFGLYSIVSPKNFVAETGEWNEGRLVDHVSSGPYKVEEQGSEHLTVVLREDFPADLRHERAFKRLNFIYSQSGGEGSDVYVGSSDYRKLERSHTFWGRNSTSILYFICHPWGDKSSPFSNPNFRRALRSRLYDELSKSGIDVSSSFFPASLTHQESSLANSYEAQDLSLSGFEGAEVSFFDTRPARSGLSNTVLAALEAALLNGGLTSKSVRGLKFEELFKNLDPKVRSHSVDIGFYATNIGINDPLGDIRHMFSSEGVWLPDENGKILKEIGKEGFSVQRVNELLEEQAIVWPVSTFKYGIWVKQHLDLSRYSTTRALGELQWIGAK